MSKEIFRWLRGEINGFYLTSLHNTLNKYAKETKDFLIQFGNQQFQVGDIRSKDLFGLGKFAGVFLPRVSTSEITSAINFTESYKVNDTEYSERGLKNTDTSRFEFYHTSENETEDINNLSTDTLRSSLVGDEEVIGYIPSDKTNVLDDSGKVRPTEISATIPNVPYSNFYGNNFLFLTEEIMEYQNITTALFFELLKAMQWIRYNGQSIVALCKIIELICPMGLVKIESFYVPPTGKFRQIHYTYHPDANTDLCQQRLLLLIYIIKTKFPQIEFIEDTNL